MASVTSRIEQERYVSCSLASAVCVCVCVCVCGVRVREREREREREGEREGAGREREGIHTEIVNRNEYAVAKLRPMIFFGHNCQLSATLLHMYVIAEKLREYILNIVVRPVYQVGGRCVEVPQAVHPGRQGQKKTLG